MHIATRGRALSVIALLGVVVYATAQISDKISKVTTGPVRQGQPVTIEAELINPAIVQRVEVAYRPFGEQTYKRMEMSIVGNIASATIPPDQMIPPFLEYYLLIYPQNSTTPETYPLENADGHPLRVTMEEAQPVSKYITVLSPEEQGSVTPDDLFISFTVRKDTIVDSAATQILVDGANVTKFAVMSGDLFILRPENASLTLSSGDHSVQVEIYSRKNELIERYQWNFKITGGIEAPVMVQKGWQYGGSLQLETRNEKIDTLPGQPYNRATLLGNASNGNFHARGKIYVTNEEQSHRQPQDRFSLTAEIPELRLGLGDLYPVYPDLIMNGLRVRGVSGELSLGSFDLAVSSGQLLRSIEGNLIKTFPHDSLTEEQGRDPGASYRLYRPGDSLWAKYTDGTYARNLFVIRPKFGTPSSFLGFTFLKSKDDPQSIFFGDKPEENLVAGSDFFISIANHTVELNGQAAMSATNKDITNGTFTDQQIDSTFTGSDSASDRRQARNVKKWLSHFITVNENLIPLTAKYFPTLAYEGGISINAADNALRFNYLRHGSSFESFGQTFVRPDVVGFNISDRQRLVRNSLLLSLGYERLNDNTAHTKAATTTSTTANIGISYFPQSELPSATVAYLFASDDNGIPTADSTFSVDDHTNRVVVQLNKDFFYYGRHQTMLSVSTSVRDDLTKRNLDTKNTSISLGVTSNYQIPLQTVVNLLVSLNTLPTTDLAGHTTSMSRNYTTLFLRGLYRLDGDRIQLSATVSPTLGDVGRTLLDGGAQYYFTKRISAVADLSLYLNKDRDNDLIGSLIVRMDL